MSQCSIQNAGCFNEGVSVTVDYVFKDKDTGEPISSADFAEFKVSDGVNILKDWTEISPADSPGSVIVDGVYNRIEARGMCDRVVTIHSIKNGEDAFQPIKYSLTNDPNVSKDSP